jgi:hypothetical protein
VDLALFYDPVLRQLKEVIGDWQLPPLLGLQVIGSQHQVYFLYLVDYQGLMRDLGILARDLDVHDLVFRVLKIELLSVSKVRREAL